MKMKSHGRAYQWPRLVVLGQALCLWIFLTLTVHAQWAGNGPPTVLEQAFTTTGGITYFRLVGLLPEGSCCQRIAGYRVSRFGSSLYQTVQQEAWEGYCVDLFCPAWHEEWVSVLGALPPGDYTLTLQAAGGLPSSWALLPFSVPTNSTPTLTWFSATQSGGQALQILVAGVSNVTYVLEGSLDFANWTPVQTNLGAPFTFSVPMTNGAAFYRTAIRQAPARAL
jgi:hypothetical protein